jgi:O-antigen ligase
LVLVLGYVLLTFRTVPRRARIWSAVAVLVLLAAGGSTYWQRMRTMTRPESDYNWSGQTYGRIALWRRGLGYIRERPVFGVGANGFPVAEATLSRVARRREMVGRSFATLNPHNIFVQVAAELGLPGLTAFVLLLVTMARTLLRVRRRFGADPVTAGVANVLLAALLGYVVCGFFLSAAYFPLLYLLIGLAAAVSAVARVPPAGPRMPAAAPGEPRGQAARGPRARYELPAPARW